MKFRKSVQVLLGGAVVTFLSPGLACSQQQWTGWGIITEVQSGFPMAFKTSLEGPGLPCGDDTVFSVDQTSPYAEYIPQAILDAYSSGSSVSLEFVQAGGCDAHVRNVAYNLDPESM